MSNRLGKRLSTFGVALFTGGMLAIAVQGGSARADDACLVKPSATTPRGGHWHYRVEPGTKRHCWYLGEERGKAALETAAKPSPFAPASDKRAMRSSAPPLRPSITNAHAELDDATSANDFSRRQLPAVHEGFFRRACAKHEYIATVRYHAVARSGHQRSAGRQFDATAGTSRSHVWSAGAERPAGLCGNNRACYSGGRRTQRAKPCFSRRQRSRGGNSVPLVIYAAGWARWRVSRSRVSWICSCQIRESEQPLANPSLAIDRGFGRPRLPSALETKGARYCTNLPQ